MARAVTRAELSAALHGAGLTGTRWFLPADSGYYQPIAAARRGAA